MVLWIWKDHHGKCRMSQFIITAPCGRWLGHSLLLNGRIFGTFIVVAKKEEVFVLDIVVWLEVLIRLAVAVGWNICHLCLTSWGLRRSLARSWLGRRDSFFSQAQRIPKLRLERQKVLLKLSLTLGIDCQHLLTKFVTTAYKTQGYKHPIKAGLVNIPSAEAKGLKAAPSEKDPSLGNSFSKDRRKSSALLLLVS